LLVIGSLLLVPSLVTNLPTVTAQATDERCFAETGFCIQGRIRTFWEANGGLPVFGFPITHQDTTFIDGRPIQAQWFERNRLELHPDNAPPYDVLLGRLGAEAVERAEPDMAPATPRDGCRFFAEMQRNVCGDFLAYWQANGLNLDGASGFTDQESLALFGLPITGEVERELEDGNTYTVQWFERARFERHPANPPGQQVLLGRLGSATLDAGQPAFQPPPRPTPVTATADPRFLTAVGDVVYFAADDGIHGRELWRSDGTAAGTSLVRDIVPGPDGSELMDLTNVQGTLYFGVGSGLQQQLWTSDGTPEGTVEVAAGVTANLRFGGGDLTPIGSQVFFIGSQDGSDLQLWVTDGTPAGTRALTATPGGILPRDARSRPIEYPYATMTVVGETLYFHGNIDERPESYALWRSDGTPDGTQPISTLDGDMFPREYWYLTPVDEALLFIARTDRQDYGLWRSNGTPAGTQQIQAFNLTRPPSAIGAFPPARLVAALGNRAYLLSGTTSAGPAGLWTSDGTPDGTRYVNDDRVASMVLLDDMLFYTTRTRADNTIALRRISEAGSAPEEITRINVQRGTTRLNPTVLTVANGALYVALNDPRFAAEDDSIWPAELWRSDGTAAGTMPVASLAWSLAVSVSAPNVLVTPTTPELVAAGGVISVVGDDGVHGSELWRTDGTVEGTRLVRDINTQPATP
jgi:ELWxxDGT repeat protein